jgi:hypothetical protein
MIVISDLLDMFVHDPQIEVNEARYLINEIVNSITKTRTLEDILVIVSIPSVDNTSYHNKSAISYNKIILPRFNKCIEAISNNEKNNMIDIKIRNSNINSRRIKNTTYDFHNHHELFFSIKERDLLTIEPRSS